MHRLAGARVAAAMSGRHARATDGAPAAGAPSGGSERQPDLEPDLARRLDRRLAGVRLAGLEVDADDLLLVGDVHRLDAEAPGEPAADRELPVAGEIEGVGVLHLVGVARGDVGSGGLGDAGNRAAQAGVSAQSPGLAAAEPEVAAQAQGLFADLEGLESDQVQDVLAL